MARMGADIRSALWSGRGLAALAGRGPAAADAGTGMHTPSPDVDGYGMGYDGAATAGQETPDRLRRMQATSPDVDGYGVWRASGESIQ
jgi:hypothetical protein